MLLMMLDVHCMHAEECVRPIFRDSSEHARAGRPAPQNFTSLQQVPHVQWLSPKKEHSYWPSKHAPELTSSRASARGALAFRGLGRTRGAEELRCIAIRRIQQVRRLCTLERARPRHKTTNMSHRFRREEHEPQDLQNCPHASASAP